MKQGTCKNFEVIADPCPFYWAYLELELRGPMPVPMADSALVDFAKVSVSVDDVDVAAFINLTASPKFSMWSNTYSLICERGGKHQFLIQGLV